MGSHEYFGIEPTFSQAMSSTSKDGFLMSGWMRMRARPSGG